ncbi:unnamed protein product [Hymenolepis diminuta]|uniref:Uncharacterized protein n=1 Tax=Hymenolepis diminuta TaxID=6216 RepID=A0A564YG12_HYMDI|nr:unnamed protein product [Hymenolepis diminuta]
MATYNCSELSFLSILLSVCLSVILFETTYRKPPSAGLFIHNIISISVFECFCC